MMAGRGIPAAHAAIPNLAPMVDVVMVILIFFMLGTTFAISEGILPTQLPSQVGPGGAAAITIVPSVRIALLEEPGGACKIVVMDRTLDRNSFDELAAFLREKRVAGADSASPVLIAAEGGVQYQNVISAMDACVRAGFSNIQFSVNATAVQAGTETTRAP
jgi:biopolymer transport protein ExbD